MKQDIMLSLCGTQTYVGQEPEKIELITEGDITRCLAIFTDISKTGSIGPVRSARTFFRGGISSGSTGFVA